MKGRSHLASILMLGAVASGWATAGENQVSRDGGTWSAGDPPSAEVIYGTDDRIEAFEAASLAEFTLFNATVAVVQRSNLRWVPGGYSLYPGSTMSQFIQYLYGYPLCDSEPYRNQPVTAFCSGFMVGPDTIVTAGQCIPDAASCADTAFVFGFHMTDPVTAVQWVPTANVYLCDTILGSAQGATEDWAVIRVDRQISGHTALPVRRTGAVETDAEVVELALCGHPVGVPAKYAGNASVRQAQPTYVSANLDSFAGNSGSPVVSLDASGRLLWAEGVVVRGNPDWVRDGACFRSSVCPDTGCTGPQGSGWEEFTRITHFAGSIPPTPACGDDFAPSATYGRLLFAAECSGDAGGFPGPYGEPHPYGTATEGIHKGPADSFYLSSSSTGFGSVIVDDEFHVNGSAIDLGPYVPQGIGYPLGLPIEFVWQPVPSHEITYFIPEGTSRVTFETADNDRFIYGNTVLYLVRDCGIWLDGKSLVEGLIINWVSHEVDVSGAQCVLHVVTGTLSELRADHDFSNACLADVVVGARQSIRYESPPPPGDGYYYLVKGTCANPIGYGDSTLIPDPRDALDFSPPCW